jgi:hypothetical protein
MPRRASRKTSRKARKSRFRWSAFWPAARTRQRWFRRFLQIPLTLQVLVAAAAIGVLWFAANGLFQVVRKPTELFFPVSGVLFKRPAETWDSYGPIFRRHSTATITPEFLAALAQSEASGNPIARTYWRFSLKGDPFEIYRPASSAVGMYQITDGTFADSRRYCIHDHRVVEDGPWDDFRSCWFNWAYFRVVPSHAVELTSAWLDVQVSRILARHRIARATLEQKQELATLIHLCGAGMADGYARRGLRFLPGQRCGDHDPRDYLRRMRAFKQQFLKLAADD